MRIHRVRRSAFLAATLIPVALFSPASAAGDLPHQVIATTPLAAVRATVIGEYTPTYNEYTCSAQLPMHRIVAWSTCPFTARFRQRLLQPGHANRGVELCGNQYPPRTVRIHTRTSTATTAHIDAHWDLGAGNSYTSTFVVVHRGGTWFVDDEYLAGKPSANIYHEGAISICQRKTLRAASR